MIANKVTKKEYLPFISSIYSECCDLHLCFRFPRNFCFCLNNFDAIVKTISASSKNNNYFPRLHRKNGLLIILNKRFWHSNVFFYNVVCFVAFGCFGWYLFNVCVRDHEYVMRLVLIRCCLCFVLAVWIFDFVCVFVFVVFFCVFMSSLTAKSLNFRRHHHSD